MSRRLETSLGLPPAPEPRTVSADGLSLRTTMMNLGNGTYLQLLEPRVGVGVAELAAQGEGALFEIAFKVASASEASSYVRGRGVTPVSLTGAPLTSGFATASSGSRYLYLPPEAVGGVRVELIEPQNHVLIGTDRDRVNR